MNDEMELNRLTKENNDCKKIIEIQQNTINRLIDYFILERANADLAGILCKRG